MNSKEKQAELYAEENNDSSTNDYYGFIAGWEACLLSFSAEKPKTEKYIFIEDTIKSSISGDVSDGYINSWDTKNRIKLPHKNFKILGIVDECINAPYAADFREEIGYTKEELKEYELSTFILRDCNYGRY